MEKISKYVECKNCKKKCFSGENTIEILDNSQVSPVEILNSAIYVCSQECFDELDDSLTENSVIREIDAEIALKKN